MESSHHHCGEERMIRVLYEEASHKGYFPTLKSLMEMEKSHHHEKEERMIRVLYEASYKGCVSTLNSLIQQDPLLLHRINSRTSFIDTPLHISVSLGHLQFTKILLAHKPSLAFDLDSFRSTALHIASAEGHIHIVKELLAAYEQACLVSDREGRIPLHVAVIRGRLEVVTELIMAKPESLKIFHRGNSVLHLCVTYNHLNILKTLVDSSLEICDELLNWGDFDGSNTILHLAIMLKQVETVRYLMSIPKIQEASMLKNKMGFTASDIADRIPKDMNSLEIQVILMNIGFKSTNKKETDIIQQAPTTTDDRAVKLPKKEKKCFRKMIKYMGKWFKHNGEWLEEMRGNLSLVATVISTMTFQSVISPPGSFIQQSIISNSPLDCLEPEGDYACPGQSVLASTDPNNFRSFMIHNTIAFMASLGVTLLLTSGLPLKNKVMMLILSMGMCVSLSELGGAYFSAYYMITPDKLWDSTDKMLNIVDLSWRALFGLVGGYILLAFLIWLFKKCTKIIKPVWMLMGCGRNRSSYGNGCCCM